MSVENAKQDYSPGDLVVLKRTLIEGPVELLTILFEITPEEDEPENLKKYLARTANHSKKVVFGVEVVASDLPKLAAA
jgi:hypothetical protein